MQIPFIDLKAQYDSIKHEINPAIQNILDTSSFVLGNAVANFESEFARAHNAKYCVALSSGTDGNHASVWALGLGYGDEIIIPGNTFIATAWGATLCGAQPVFVDCDPESYNIDPQKVEKAITSNTKAIVAVHLYGQPADIDPLKKLAREYNLFLIEDSAQAHIAEYKGKKVGGLGDISSFSFYPGKNLGAYGEGGAVLTNKFETSRVVKMLRDHGTLEKYSHESFGHNYRMEGIQGAVLRVKLKYLKLWTDARRKIANKYNELLSEVEEIALPKEMEYAKHVYHLFVIRVLNNTKKSGKVRDKLVAYLKDKGISVGLHYPIPLHLQKCFNYLGYKQGELPVTEELSNTCLSLPIYPELSDDKIEYVSSHIKKFFNKQN